MRKSRFTEEQIVLILREAEAGTGTTELYRLHGITKQTFYRWKEKYGGLASTKRGGCGSWKRRTGG